MRDPGLDISGPLSFSLSLSHAPRRVCCCCFFAWVVAGRSIDRSACCCDGVWPNEWIRRSLGLGLAVPRSGPKYMRARRLPRSRSRSRSPCTRHLDRAATRHTQDTQDTRDASAAPAPALAARRSMCEQQEGGCRTRQPARELVDQHQYASDDLHAALDAGADNSRDAHY